jgi:hypothetical protein
MRSYHLLPYLISAVAGLSVASAQTLLNDNFPGTSLDSSNWSAITPVPGASVAVNNGLILTNGGTVLTQSGFPKAIKIDMSFEFTGTDFDSFKLVTRTNGAMLLNNSGEFDQGIRVSFRMRSDPTDPAGTNDNVEMDDIDYPTGQTELGIGTFAMTQGETYNIELLETDTSVSLFIDDFSTPFLTAATTSSYGDLIGLDNREGAAAGSSISEGSQVTVESLSVSTVPDSGTTAIYLGIAISLLAAVAQKKASRSAVRK